MSSIERSKAIPMQDPAPNVMFLVEVVNCNDGIASYCETLATGLHGRGVLD